MKRAVGLLVLVAALVALAVAAGASASNGNGNANKNANGAQTGHFTSTYTNGIGGKFVCAGERIAKAGAFIKDEEGCTISNAAAFFPAGKEVGNPYFTFHGVNWYWFSDFDGKIAKTITYIVSPAQPDGSAHLKIIAYY